MTSHLKKGETLETIQEFIAERGYPPTRREIMTSIDRASAQYHIRKLEEAGKIKITPRVSRGLKVIV